MSILVFDTRPVMFKQSRLGKNNKPFILYKFRTLAVKGYSDFEFSHEDVTKMGRFLRASGFDEIPQLLNVIKGEMSLVGPRPLPEEYVDLLNGYSKTRSLIKPGITGLVQTKGGNELDWPERFRLDDAYASDISFKKDIIILLKTVLSPFKTKITQSKTLTHSI